MKKETLLNQKQQIILQDYFRKSLEGDSMENIAKENGIARKTLSKWKNTNHGRQLHAEWKKEVTKDAIPEYLDVLKVKALSGSYKHMELFAKIFDLLSPEKQEIISKNENHDIVKDGVSKDYLKELESLLDEGEDKGKVVKLQNVAEK